MRIGSNPQKAANKTKLKTNHRVIVVVFIPELTGYYKNSLEVFQFCVQSLISANSGRYEITLVNNGSCEEVSKLINTYNPKDIDTVIHHRTNIGKIDALIGAARGAREDLITLSDADILFTNNWDKATQEIFSNFRNIGSVSPIPFRHGLFYGTSSVLKEVLLKRVSFSFKEIPENFDNQAKYLKSINWNKEKDNKVTWPVIKNGDFEAIVGSGHQVLTVKREILLSTVPKKPSLTLVGGSSELKYIDEPIDKSGGMRVSTYHNYAYHMGNQLESWMREKFETRRSLKKEINLNPPEVVYDKGLMSKIRHKSYIYKKHFIKRLFKAFHKIE